MAKSSLSEMARKAIKRKKGRPPQESLETVLSREVGDNGQQKDGDVVEVEATTAEGGLITVERERALAVFEDGLEFDLERIKRRIWDCGANILESSINIGKYLIWAKEEAGHGEFVRWVTEDVGMSTQRASECMRIAHRVIENQIPAVREFYRLAAGGSKKKFLALLDVTDEEIEEVMETESFLGRDLDAVESMSYQQLKEALRAEKDRTEILRDKQEATERKLQTANARITKYQNPDEPESDSALTILDRQFVKVIGVVGVLERIATEFAEEYGDEGLMEKETRDCVDSYAATLNQKFTNIRLILTPDEIAGERWHIQKRAGEDSEEDSEESGGE